MQVRRWPSACLAGALVWLISTPAVCAASSPAPQQPAAERSARRSQETCLACHGDRALGVRTPQGKVLSLHVDPERFRASVHGALSCVSCHGEMHGGPGVAGTPAQGAPPKDALSSPERACATCHPDESREFLESTHAAAARAGNRDAPTCNDCHGAHEIRRAEDLESSTSAANVPATCARCHAQSTLMARYDVNTRVVDTYHESFHGKKSHLGSERAAVCTSCHGVHGILGPDDPKSRVFAANRPQTCGQAGCHPGASLTFGLGFSHQAVSRAQKPLAFWVQTLYTIAIVGTIGGMFVYMGADLLRRVLRALRRQVDASDAPRGVRP